MAIVFTYTPPAVDAGALVHGMVEGAELAGAEALLQASQPLVPVEHGDLRDSGKVEPGPHGAEVSYSATNPEDGYNYAVIQHEREDFHHPNGGQAHYLSDPMVTEQAAIMAAMAARVKI